jgi:hypothetical protein
MPIVAQAAIRAWTTSADPPDAVWIWVEASKRLVGTGIFRRTEQRRRGKNLRIIVEKTDGNVVQRIVEGDGIDKLWRVFRAADNHPGGLQIDAAPGPYVQSRSHVAVGYVVPPIHWRPGMK